MKFMKWKSLALTCAVCLLPILLGVALWGRLPEVMAVHFRLDNEPDGFASKGFVVFGLPVLMALLQTFCCFVNDWNAYRHGERKKFSRATKWIIPVLAVVIQVATLGYGLGWKLDIRRLVCFLVGAVLVVVGNYLPKFEGAGSGFIVKQDNDQLLIVTNNHVVDSADKITVQFNDGESAAAEVKGSSESNDLAVITVDMNKLKDSTKKSIRVASLGNSDEAKVGQMVIAIGNALGYGQSVTVGYVSAKNREVSTADETTGKSTTQILMQTDAAINPGNSGGALIDTRGNVIGINSSKYFSYGSTSVEGMGYAIPMSSAVSVINDLMDREVLKDNEKGYLGITGSTIKESENKAYGIPIGVYVRAVSDTGAAYKAGIKQGDVITKINGRKVQSIEAVQEIVNNTKVGTTIEVTVMRSDDGEYKEKEIKVTLKSKDTLDGLEDDSDDSSSQQGSYGNNYDENDSQVVPWGSSIY